MYTYKTCGKSFYCTPLTFFYNDVSYMSALANSVEPDKIPHNTVCSTLFAKAEEKKIQFYLFLLNIYNGPSQVYCIKQERRIY